MIEQRREKGVVALVVVAFLLLTVARIALSLQRRGAILGLYPPGGVITGYGVLVDDPVQVYGLTRLLVKLEAAPSPVVSLASPFDLDFPLRFGDRVWIEARVIPLNPCTTDLDWDDLLRFRHLKGWCERVKFAGVGTGNPLSLYLHRLRSSLYLKIREAFGEEVGSLLAALVMGMREQLSRQLRSHFRASGLAHLLAVSGFHVGVVALVIFSMLGLVLRVLACLRPTMVVSPVLVPWNLASILTIPLIFLYVMLTGGRASALRAALMLSLYLVARVAGRERPLFAAVAASLLVLLLVNPLFLFQKGFQLTYLAMAGIMVILEVCRRVGDRLRLSRVLEGVAVWLAISLLLPLFLWPWLGLLFHRISVTAPVSNLLLTPLASLLIAGGFLWVPLSFFMPTAWSKVVGAPLVALSRAFLKGISVVGSERFFHWITLGDSLLLLALLASLVILLLVRNRLLALLPLGLVVLLFAFKGVLAKDGVVELVHGSRPVLLCRWKGGFYLTLPPLSSYKLERCVLPGLMERDADTLEKVVITGSSRRSLEALDVLEVLSIREAVVPMRLYLDSGGRKGLRPLLREERVGCFGVRPLGKRRIGVFPQ